MKKNDLAKVFCNFHLAIPIIKQISFRHLQRNFCRYNCRKNLLTFASAFSLFHAQDLRTRLRPHATMMVEVEKSIEEKTQKVIFEEIGLSYIIPNTV